MWDASSKWQYQNYVEVTRRNSLRSSGALQYKATEDRDGVIEELSTLG